MTMIKYILSFGFVLFAMSLSKAQCDITGIRLGGMVGDVFIGPVCNGDGTFRTCFYLSGSNIPTSGAIVNLNGTVFPVAFNIIDGAFTVVCLGSPPDGISDDCWGIGVDISYPGVLKPIASSSILEELFRNKNTGKSNSQVTTINTEAKIVAGICAINAYALFDAPNCDPDSLCTLNPIPTIGEWGLVLLGISLLILGVVAVRNYGFGFVRS